MVISSFYSVFTTTRIQLYMKMLEGKAGLKIVHHFENDEFDYYVMKDSVGNSTDLIQFKNKKVKEGFYAIRINVNDFDEMVSALQKVGYSLKDDETVETDSFKLGFLVSATGAPNILLFEHKEH